MEKINHQPIILTGLIIWVAGCYLDFSVVRYSDSLIVAGTVISYIGAILFLLTKENRTRVKEVFFPKKRGFVESFKQLFDWSRVSVAWTLGLLFAMLLLIISSKIMKSMGAYESAIEGVKKDAKVSERVGEVLGFTFMVTGNASTQGSSELHFGVMGSKGSLRVRAGVDSYNGNHVFHHVTIED